MLQSPKSIDEEMSLNKNTINKIRNLRKQGLSYRDIKKITGIDKNTIMKNIKNDINDEIYPLQPESRANGSIENFANPYSYGAIDSQRKTSQRINNQNAPRRYSNILSNDPVISDYNKTKEYSNNYSKTNDFELKKLRDENHKLLSKIKKEEEENRKQNALIEKIGREYQQRINELEEKFREDVKKRDEARTIELKELTSGMKTLVNKMDEQYKAPQIIAIQPPLDPLKKREQFEKSTEEQKKDIEPDNLQYIPLRMIEQEQQEDEVESSSYYGDMILLNVATILGKWFCYHLSPDRKCQIRSPEYWLGLSEVFKKNEKQRLRQYIIHK